MHSKKQCSACYNRHYKKNNKRYLITQKTRRALPENKLKNKEYHKNYRLKNKDKVKKAKNDYRKNNPLSRRGENEFRKRTIKNQIIAKQYRKQILSFYKNTPKGFQVDHIIPIMHKDVCGLHVPWNLQYLSPIDNNKKNNHWDGTYNNDGWKK